MTELEWRLLEGGVDRDAAHHGGEHLTMHLWWGRMQNPDLDERRRAARVRTRVAGRPARFLAAAMSVIDGMPMRRATAIIDRLVAPDAYTSITAATGLVRQSGMIVAGRGLAMDLIAMHGAGADETGDAVRQRWARALVRHVDRREDLRTRRDDDDAG